jgi:hypothetical protein
LALWDEFGIVTQLVVSLDVISEEHHDNIDHQEPPATVLPAGVGENDGGTDIEVVDYPMSVLVHVELAKTPRKYSCIHRFSYCILKMNK